MYSGEVGLCWVVSLCRVGPGKPGRAVACGAHAVGAVRARPARGSRGRRLKHRNSGRYGVRAVGRGARGSRSQPTDREELERGWHSGFQRHQAAAARYAVSCLDSRRAGRTHVLGPSKLLASSRGPQNIDPLFPTSKIE